MKKIIIISLIILFFIIIFFIIALIILNYKTIINLNDSNIEYFNEEKKEKLNFKDFDRNEIIIAAIGSKSGESEIFGKQLFQISRIIVDNINKKGGILNKKIKLLELDSQSSPIIAKACANEAIENGAIAVIGDTYSSYCLAIAPILQEAKIPMITPSASNPKITLIGDYIFRVCYTDLHKGIILANFTYNDLKAKKVAILKNIGYDYCIDLANYYKKQLSNFSNVKILEKEFLNNISDYEKILKEIKEFNPDLIFLPSYFQEAFQIINISRKLGIKSIFLGGDAWHTIMQDWDRDVVEGSYYVKNLVLDKYIILNNPILKEYQEKYGLITDAMPYLTYDAFFILFDAIWRVKSFDREAIKEALLNTKDYKGLTSNIKFNYNGDPFININIFKFEKNNIKFIKSLGVDKINIASIFAKTGIAATDNIPQILAVRLAVDEVNMNGGIKGRLINLIEFDNESNALIAKNCAEQAVKMDILASIGSSWSSHTIAIAPIFQKAKIPMISPVSTNPEITLIGDYIFRACYNDNIQGEVLAKFAINELKVKKAITLVNLNSKFSIDLSTIFSNKFSELGGKVVWSGEYLEQDNDFSVLLSNVQNKDADIIFLPGYIRDSALIIKQARKKGIKIPFLGADGWNDSMYEYAGKDIIGNYFSTFWHTDVPTQKSKKFIENYEKRFGKIYNYGVASSYDAAYILINSINSAKKLIPFEVRNSLAGIKNYQGASGMFSFDENRNPIKSIVILQFKENKSVFIRTVSL